MNYSKVKRLRTSKKEFEVGCALMEAAVETNCPAGGDGGHGGFTKVTIQCSTGVSLHPGVEFDSIHFSVGGDWEAYALAQVLRWLGCELAAMLPRDGEHAAMEAEVQ